MKRLFLLNEEEARTLAWARENKAAINYIRSHETVEKASETMTIHYIDAFGWCVVKEGDTKKRK